MIARTVIRLIVRFATHRQFCRGIILANVNLPSPTLTD
jgi:hypothetical protein